MTIPYIGSNNLFKSRNCGELRSSHIGEDLLLAGWVNKVRDLGGVYFLTLRDKTGIIQLGFESFDADLSILKELSLESVIQVKGVVRARPEGATNKDMPTGEVEVQVSDLKILSRAHEVPFLPHGKIEAGEDLRLKYRYLDLRSEKLQSMLSLRSEMAKRARMVLYNEDFTEVETPILYKTTPEGARDYIVPSRVHPGRVYALPQSPQTLKQLLMIAGTDRYFQICKCFRDEDLRADRQPEFSQIDIEVSFSTAEYMRGLASRIIEKIFDLKPGFEIPIMSYSDAMKDYGSDKPDVRFDLKHQDVTEKFKGCGFKTFAEIADSNGLIKAMFISSKDGEFARKQIDGFTEVVKPYGGKGVAWFKVKSGEFTGGISKFITDDLKTSFNKEDGLWVFCADSKKSVTHACANALRLHLGKECNLIDPDAYKFLWINDWPLFEYDEEAGRLFAAHHPFTSPKLEDFEKFKSGDIEIAKTIQAEAYDVVCNGYELAGGSVRIYDTDLQAQMFKYLDFSEEEAQRLFGFFIEALKYGTPPHAGMAFGLDRLIMLVGKTDNIRDVIAFPKTTSATDLMSSSPSVAQAVQLEELKMNFLK